MAADHTPSAAQDHIEMLIRGWRRHADLSRRRFMEVERGEALELLDEIERLREALRISYPATPVDCLLSELRECFDLSADDLISRRQFENHVAEFRKEAVVDAA